MISLGLIHHNQAACCSCCSSCSCSCSILFYYYSRRRRRCRRRHGWGGVWLEYCDLCVDHILCKWVWRLEGPRSSNVELELPDLRRDQSLHEETQNLKLFSFRPSWRQIPENKPLLCEIPQYRINGTENGNWTCKTIEIYPASHIVNKKSIMSLRFKNDKGTNKVTNISNFHNSFILYRFPDHLIVNWNNFANSLLFAEQTNSI